MQDDLGCYYYPDPADTRTRVYVRKGVAGPEFRLWRAGLPEVWEKHGWRGEDVLRAAAGKFREGAGGGPLGIPKGNPLKLYDFNVAEALLKNFKE
jgi:hypothetical protein